MSRPCPMCGSHTLNNLTSGPGVKYLLTEVDTSKNPPSVNVGNGLPVTAIGCSSCGVVYLHNDKLIGIKPD